jgi:hypothetical protein
MCKIIDVPFRLTKEIYESHKKGIPNDVLCVLGCNPPWVVNVVVRFERRKELRRQYLVDKEPA